MAQVHLVLSQKGGVGKTTTAVNLAAVVADVLGGDPEKPPVLVISLDPQGSAVWWAERTNVDQLPFDFDQLDDRPDEVAKLSGLPDYEHVFVDTPGSFARPAVLARAMEVATDALIPVTPEPLAYGPTETTIRDIVEPRSLPYRVIRNNWDRRDGLPDLTALTDWLDQRKLRYTKTIIRRYKMHTNAAAEGRVVTQYPTGRTATEARSDFLTLALELGYGGKVAD